MLALTLYCAGCIVFIFIMLVMEDCLMTLCCPNNSAADGVAEVLAVHQVVSLQSVSEASQTAMVAADRLPKPGVLSNVIELGNAPRGSGNVQEGDEEEGNTAPAAQIRVRYIARDLN